MEGETTGDGVECAVGKRRVVNAAFSPFDIGEPTSFRELARLVEHGGGCVETDDARGARGKSAGDRAGAAGQIDGRRAFVKRRGLRHQGENFVGMQGGAAREALRLLRELIADFARMGAGVGLGHWKTRMQGKARMQRRPSGGKAVS